MLEKKILPELLSARGGKFTLDLILGPASTSQDSLSSLKVQNREGTAYCLTFNFTRPTPTIYIFLEKAMATQWKIPWMEEPGRLQFTGSQRVEHGLTFTFTVWFTLVISLGNGLLGQRKLFQHWEVLYDSHLAAWATHRAAALRMCSEGNAECYEWAQLWSLLAARQTKPWPLLSQGSFNTSLQSTSAFPKLWSSSPLTGTLLSLFPWIYAMKAKVEAGFICWVPVNVGSWSHNTRAC